MTDVLTRSLPVVDLGGTPRTELLEAIRSIGTEWGAFLVVNHGIDAALLDDFDARIERLISKPHAEKAELASPVGHPYRGRRQWPDDFGRLELERYVIGRYGSREEAIAAGVPEEHASLYDFANVWPADDPDLPQAAAAYREAHHDLIARLLELFAEALAVPAHRLQWDGPDVGDIVVNEYPTWTWPDTDDDLKLLLLEHADGDVVTLLRQHGGYAGLNVQHDDGHWVPVPVVPGSIVVLFGSLLTNLTNGTWVPGRHRVVAGANERRRSIAVFYSPGTNVTIEPIPELVGDGEHDFEPVSIWDREKSGVAEYLKVFGRPAQISAWKNGDRYVAEVVNPAG